MSKFEKGNYYNICYCNHFLFRLSDGMHIYATIILIFFFLHFSFDFFYILNLLLENKCKKMIMCIVCIFAKKLNQMLYKGEKFCLLSIF